MRTCRIENCYFPVFSKGYCKFHQYKKGISSAKSKTIGLKPTKVKYDKELVKQDREFYMEIWKERFHVCYSCGAAIYKPRTYNFHHLLEKGVERYAHLRHEKKNIMILCGDCHASTTNGFPSLQVQRATQEAKEYFEEKNLIGTQ